MMPGMLSYSLYVNMEQRIIYIIWSWWIGDVVFDYFKTCYHGLLVLNGGQVVLLLAYVICYMLYVNNNRMF